MFQAKVMVPLFAVQVSDDGGFGPDDCLCFFFYPTLYGWRRARKRSIVKWTGHQQPVEPANAQLDCIEIVS